MDFKAKKNDRWRHFFSDPTIFTSSIIWLFADYSWLFRVFMIIHDYYKTITRLLQDYYRIIHDYYKIIHDYSWLLQDYSWLFMIIQTVQQFCIFPCPKTDALRFFDMILIYLDKNGACRCYLNLTWPFEPTHVRCPESLRGMRPIVDCWTAST